MCRDEADPTFATHGMFRRVVGLLLLKLEDREWGGGDELCVGELKIGKYLDQGHKYNICHHASLKINQCSAKSDTSGGFDLTMKLDVCTLR